MGFYTRKTKKNRRNYQLTETSQGLDSGIEEFCFFMYGGGGVLVDPRIRDDEQDLDFKGKQTDIYAMALALLFFAAGASPFEFRSNEKLVSGGFIQAPLKGRGDEELQK